MAHARPAFRLSRADQGTNVTSATNTPPNRIVDLAISNDIGMKFVTSEVETVKNNVSTNFKNAESKMNSIDAVYKRVDWKSEAADAFYTKFTKLKGEILAAFENIDAQFTKLMNETLSDIQNTENANTVQ